MTRTVSTARASRSTTVMKDSIERTEVAETVAGVKDIIKDLPREEQLEALRTVRAKLEDEREEVEATITSLNEQLAVLDTWRDLDKTMALAVRAWEQTIKIGLAPDKCIEVYLAMASVKLATKAGLSLVTAGSKIADPGTRKELAMHILWAAWWAHAAFPRLQTSHTYAAALMCTDVYPGLVDELEPHWVAFDVAVPDRLVVVDDIHFARVRVACDPRERHCWITALTDEGCVVFTVGGDSLGGTLANDDDKDARVARVKKVLFRLVAGLLVAMQHTTNFRERVVHGKRRPGQRSGAPDHRVVIIGAPIKVDARPALTEYLAGHTRGSGRKTGPASFQVLVRGHYKRQVHGLRRSLRKVVWIEPFWRGPEDAPILSRPKRLGDQRS